MICDGCKYMYVSYLCTRAVATVQRTDDHTGVVTFKDFYSNRSKKKNADGNGSECESCGGQLSAGGGVGAIKELACGVFPEIARDRRYGFTVDGAGDNAGIGRKLLCSTSLEEGVSEGTSAECEGSRGCSAGDGADLHSRFAFLGGERVVSCDADGVSREDCKETSRPVNSVEGSGETEVSEKTLANRARRHARRDLKRERKAKGRVRGLGSDVPEWRRKDGVSEFDLRRSEEEPRASKFGSPGFFSALAEDKRSSLRESRAQMLEAKNLLEAAKAKRQLERFEKGELSTVQQARELRAAQQLEVLKAKDLELEKKRVNTRMLREAECDKVKIEQSFAKLAVTGNVPHVGGSVKTIVSDATSPLSSGTISPNSSVSMKEIHDMMEELATLKRERVEHLEFASHVKTLHPLIYDTLAPKVREKDKVFPPETEYEPTENGGFPDHAWELEENLGMFDLEPDNKFRRRPDPEDTSGLIEYHKRRFHQFGIPVPYKSELGFIADNHFGSF